MAEHAPPLYTTDMAEAMKARAGEKYQPSNGDEGEMFMERWCALCSKDNLDHETFEGGCPIIAYTMALQVDDPDYPKEWVISPDGQPVCTAFDDRAAAERAVAEAQAPRCPDTLEMPL